MHKRDNRLMVMAASVLVLSGSQMGCGDTLDDDATENQKQAHYVYEAGTLYLGDFCVMARSEISHGSGGGYSKVDTNATKTQWTPIGDFECIGWLYKPPGYLAASYHLMKWDGKQWGICYSSDWSFNSKTASKQVIERDFGRTPPCGAGYYGTGGVSYVKDNNEWYGGGIWSGYHGLGTVWDDRAVGPDNTPVPRTPDWVKKGNQIDMSRFPERFPVIGADGKTVTDQSGKAVTVQVSRTPPVSPEESSK
jgi:hypothetical protein